MTEDKRGRQKDGCCFQCSLPTQRPLTVHVPAQWPAVGPKQVLHSFEDRLQLLLLPDLRLRHLSHVQLAVCQLFCGDKDKVMRQECPSGRSWSHLCPGWNRGTRGTWRLSPNPWPRGAVLRPFLLRESYSTSEGAVKDETGTREQLMTWKRILQDAAGG